MSKNAKMAAVGEHDVVLAYAAMGMTVHPTDSAQAASRAIHALAKDGYAIIFITEQVASSIPETLEKYQSQALPAIIPIPGSRGTTGLGMRQVRANVEKAIGADILFEKEGG